MIGTLRHKSPLKGNIMMGDNKGARLKVTIYTTEVHLAMQGKRQ